MAKSVLSISLFVFGNQLMAKKSLLTSTCCVMMYGNCILHLILLLIASKTLAHREV